ncbi:MAG: biopolymer transporter ExbD [Phycisphaerales bacterium]|nr:biopolymer transporter ExbD [Phycisphaerales bacterium]
MMRFVTRDVRDVEGHLPLTSLIDVVFLLLVFFLLTASIMPPEEEIASSLKADQEGRGAQDFTPQVVNVESVDGEPGFRIGERLVRTREHLEAIITELPKEQGVFVRVAGDVPMDAAAAALQACKNVGFSKVTYVPRTR